MGFRPPSNGPDSLHGLARASPATSQGPFVPGTSTNDGFAPGHPLVKDGRRHYGSKKLIRYTLYWRVKNKNQKPQVEIFSLILILIL